MGPHTAGDKTVEDALVAAFKAMPGRAYWLTDRLRTADRGQTQVTAILNEAAIALADDQTALAYLLGWARCRAWAQNFADYCRVRGWKRPSAEKGRRRGVARILACRRDASTLT